MGFTRDELSNLDMNTIIKSQNFSKRKLQKAWNKKIELEKRKKQYNKLPKHARTDFLHIAREDLIKLVREQSGGLLDEEKG